MVWSHATADIDRARLLATSSPHSGDWLAAPPITSVGLRLSDVEIRIAVAHRLGCKACEPHTRVCGKVVDAPGLRGLACRRSAPRQQRQSFQRHYLAGHEASTNPSSQRTSGFDASRWQTSRWHNHSPMVEGQATRMGRYSARYIHMQVHM